MSNYTVSTSNCSIRPINKTLSDSTIPGRNKPERNCNEGVLRIIQSSSITGSSPSHCSVPYQAHALGEAYPSVEMQSVYSVAPADGAKMNGGISLQNDHWEVTELLYIRYLQLFSNWHPNLLKFFIRASE